MSWFKKIAQIWLRRVNYGDYTELESELIDVYRLTYIYNLIRNKINETGFSVMKRFENILNEIKKEISIQGSSLKNKMLYTFGHWLEEHAIFGASNTDQWAKVRINTNREYVESGEDNYSFTDGAMNEYKRYSNNDTSSNIFNIIMNNKNMTLLQNYLKQSAIEYINGYDKNELREIYQVPRNKNPYDYIIKKIENGDYSAQDIYPVAEDLRSLLEIFRNNPEIDEECAYILYRDYVYPLWWKYWQPKGIKKTRARIESVFNMLQSASPNNVDNFLATINIAINTAHQNGSMLEYLENQHGASNLSYLMRDLTNGRFNNEWEQEVNQLFGVYE